MLGKEKLTQRFAEKRAKIKAFISEHGDKPVSTVNVKQVFTGMRGVTGLVCNTSWVPANQGLIIRGHPILDLVNKTPDEVFYLLLSGGFPSPEELQEFQDAIEARQPVPRYVWNVLNAMPDHSHPMAMLSAALLALEAESKFRKAYKRGIPKDEHWVYVLEDSLNIIAKLPAIAANIYRLHYDRGPRIYREPGLTLGEQYAHMLGLAPGDPSFKRLMNLYLVLHSDHGGGNVSNFTAHTVGSALSDPYYALAAGLNGLAGPLHGLASQESIKFLLGLIKRYPPVPTVEQIRDHAHEMINAGKVVPGYGHAVLRVTDPRFTAFKQFGDTHVSGDPVYRTALNVFEAVPGVLQEFPKIANPWPNVDALSGTMLYHYGMTEVEYYTVPFAVARSLGILANLVLHRGMGSSIVRPQAVSQQQLAEDVGDTDFFCDL